jgi:hypothetical protein
MSCRGSAVVPEGRNSVSGRNHAPDYAHVFNILAGTAGWIRTTDLLIHSHRLMQLSFVPAFVRQASLPLAKHELRTSADSDLHLAGYFVPTCAGL